MDKINTQRMAVTDKDTIDIQRMVVTDLEDSQPLCIIIGTTLVLIIVQLVTDTPVTMLILVSLTTLMEEQVPTLGLVYMVGNIGSWSIVIFNLLIGGIIHIARPCESIEGILLLYFVDILVRLKGHKK